MRIETLTLKGFLGFQGQVSLDLRDVPSGLVAVCGPNGAGKTTVLEAAPAALFREWMSRGDVVNYATGRDSFLEVQIGLEGRGTYIARLNVDGVKRGSDATLSTILADGTRRVLTDGKVSTYAAAVATVFPSREVLLASAFSAQNKAGSFTSLDRKSRKALFAELLGIERYQSMSEVAKQAGRILDERRSALLAERGVVAEFVSPAVIDDIDGTAQRLQVEGGNAELEQLRLQKDIAEAEARLATMADQAAAFAAASLRVTTAEGELSGLRFDLDKSAHDATAAKVRGQEDTIRIGARRVQQLKEVAAARSATDARLEQELAAADARRDAVAEDVRKRTDGNKQILSKAQDITAAVARIAAIDTALAGLATTRVDIGTALARVAERVAELDREAASLEVAKGDLERCRTAAKGLTVVPCGGQGAFSGCDLIASAVLASRQVPALEARLQGVPVIEEALRTQQAERLELDSQARAVADSVATLTTERAAVEDFAKYAGALASARTRIEELSAHADKAEADRLADRNAAMERFEASAREIEARERRIAEEGTQELEAVAARVAVEVHAAAEHGAVLTRKVEDAEARLAGARQDLSGLADASSLVAELQGRLASLRRRWDELTAILARVQAGAEDLDRRRASVGERLTRLTRLDAVLGVLENDLLEWQTLEQYLGRDGLQKLEIDAAGPTVAAYTNQLLEVCYGTRFSVDIVTQVEKAGGKGMKEDFAVLVLDNERGGEPRDLSDLSGGEQVIVAEALSAAICIYSNMRSGAPIRTCWRDETTGALDAANADRYIAMLRKMQELGGFEHVLFISHNADAAAQADAQIRVGGGTASLAFPPYAREEAA